MPEFKSPIVRILWQHWERIEPMLGGIGVMPSQLLKALLPELDDAPEAQEKIVGVVVALAKDLIEAQAVKAEGIAKMEALTEPATYGGFDKETTKEEFLDTSE